MKFTGIYYSLITVLADRTGLEPATSAVTGQHSNQLNYRSKILRTNSDVASLIGTLKI